VIADSYTNRRLLLPPFLPPSLHAMCLRTPLYATISSLGPRRSGLGRPGSGPMQQVDLRPIRSMPTPCSTRSLASCRPLPWKILQSSRSLISRRRYAKSSLPCIPQAGSYDETSAANEDRSRRHPAAATALSQSLRRHVGGAQMREVFPTTRTSAQGHERPIRQTPIATNLLAQGARRRSCQRVPRIERQAHGIRRRSRREGFLLRL
jgi:hypothetical protein